MPDEIRDLLDMAMLLERHSQEAQHRMVQYLVGKVGLMPTLTREYERLRKADQRYVPESVRDNGSGTLDLSPIPVVATPVSRSVSRFERALTQSDLDKAKALLKAEDFEFLQVCPEPFRTQWLGDADWWVSLRDGYPKVNAQQQASRYMAWAGARRKRDHRAALRNWFAKADRWRESDEMRKAVRG